MNTTGLTYNWYAVRVRSRTEKRVNADLLDQGIDSFLPLYRKLRIWSDRKKWVEMPLISGYVFVHISIKEYEVVLQTMNVARYVYYNGKAAVIKENDILTLKRMLGQSELPLEVTLEDLKPGQMVEVVAGPLCGMVGELIEYKGKNKVALRIEPLGYTVLVEAPEKTLMPYAVKV